MEIKLSKGIFNPRWNDGKKRKPILETLANQGSAAFQLSKFKYDQTIYPEAADTRKVSSACSHCFPNNQLDEEVESLGIRNLFDLETSNPNKPFMVRQFPFLSYFWNKGATSADQLKYIYKKEILDDPDLFMYPIQKNSLILSTENVEKWTKIVQEISADVSHSYPVSSLELLAIKFLIRMMGLYLGKILQGIFDKVCVHQGEIELLQRANATALPIIYIPLSQSFMDHMILRWTLIHSGLPIPRFITSNGLRKLTRYIGGISFSQNRHNQSNIDERESQTAALSSCIRTHLKKGSSLLFHVEPNKSRSGKPSTELYGTEILKILYDVYESKDIEDAYIVPVSVSYEILPESNNGWFTSPSLSDKSLWKFLKSVWASYKTGLGQVRIDFGQPFGLREFSPSVSGNKKMVSILNSEETKESYSKTYETSELNWCANSGSTSSIPSLYGDMNLIDFKERDNLTPPLLDILAHHVTYSAMHARTIMSTHIVAFLLLKKFRWGTNLKSLVCDTIQLKKLLEKRHRGFGFTGDITSAVLRGIQLLGPNLITITKETNDNDFTVSPVLTQQSLLQLGYYANNIIPSFAMEAIVAVAVFALAGNQLTISRGFDQEIRIKDEELMNHARMVYAVFATEFFLHPPCLIAETAIRRALDSLNDDSVLQFLMDETVKRTRRLYEAEMEDEYYQEEGDTTTEVTNLAGGECFFRPYEYKISSSESNYEMLSFLRNLLVPYLEIYSLVGKELENLPATSKNLKQIDQRLFQRRLFQKIKEDFPVERYGEYLIMDTIKSALFAFEANAILWVDVDGNTKNKIIMLESTPDSQEKLKQTINSLLRYVTF